MANKNFKTLTRQQDFERLKSKGRRIPAKNWLLVSVLSNKGLGLRCGWSIPAKIGGAVLRNRYKRWCREFFRKVGCSLVRPDLDIHVIIRIRSDVNYKEISFGEFEGALSAAWKVAQRGG